MLSGFKNFFNSSKISSTLVPGIKYDYSLNVAKNVLNEQDETCSTTWKQLCSFWNYMSLIEIKYFNALIDHFWSTVKNNQEAYEKTVQITRNNDYTTVDLLDY